MLSRASSIPSRMVSRVAAASCTIAAARTAAVLTAGRRANSTVSVGAYSCAIPSTRIASVKSMQMRGYASKSFPPHVIMNMPALSPTMTQGNIGVWKKKIGDSIQPGDVLVEIETDKASMDFECQEEGFLAQTFLKTGDKDVPVGTALCVFAENQADIPAFANFSLADIGGAAPAPAAPAAPVSTPAASSAPVSKSSDFPAHTLMGMPALSPTMTQGNVGTWKKKVGDKVVPGDTLVEIETDKASMDFECQEEGYLAKVFVEAGTKDVLVGTALCILADSADGIAKFEGFTVGSGVPSTDAPAAPAAAAAPSANASTPSTVAAAPARKAGERLIVSPAAKFIAAQKGIPLENIVGTGPKGRILKGDVLSYKGAPAAAAKSAAPSYAASAPAPVSFTPAPPSAQAYIDTPVSNIRKVIAARLTESKQSIPHYYLTIELDADQVLNVRESLNKQANGRFKISVNDFVIKASSLALRDVPAVNSAWQGSFIREYQTSDIAIAVATENGLITPIVQSAEGKGLSVIANNVKSLAEKARDGKLQPHEYQGGSFTISNLGMFGIKSFTAIINPPHAAILAVGGVEEKLVIDAKAEKGFRSKKVFNVTLSCDHRVVDGAVGAKWLQAFKGYIENPMSMIL
ncbi:mitochondrial dihydrolipoamide acetyltransferase precursor [Chytriomyces cf. hyalinus JEL632]|nr:mitochondrial dihydrolipoamide acetyltransferase precursor [Chytriomyces cf. hyalinus JEL632]